MKRLVSIGCALVFLGCGSMEDVSLYSEDLTPTPEERVLSFPHRTIFSDSDNSTMFGVKEHPCKRVAFIEENSVEGKDHLAVEWTQTESCRYIGMGFPWANYAGKNLKSLENIAALQFQLRLESGSVSKIPMFFALVDYGGKQASTKVNLLNVEGGKMDDTWRTVHIPISSFHASSKGVNLENIKELRIEFQREGHVHLDDLKIVPFEHETKKLPSRSSEVCQGLPMTLDETKLWWGIGKRNTIQWSGSQDRGALTLNYDNARDDKDWNSFGVALNAWEPVDMSDVHSASALTFELQGEFAPLVFAIWSLTGAPRQIRKVLAKKDCVECEGNVWKCAVPIKSFSQFDRFNWRGSREVRVTMNGDIQAQFRNFQWQEYRGNPDKPQRWIERQFPCECLR